MLLALLLAGCAPAVTLTPAPATAIQTQTPTSLPDPSAASGWKKFVDPTTNMSLDYPENWDVRAYPDSDGLGSRVEFSSPDNKFGVRLFMGTSAETIKLAKKKIKVTPYVNDEAGNTVMWKRPVNTALFSGWEVIIGPYPEGVNTPAPEDYTFGEYLTWDGLYVDRQRELVVTLMTDFDYQTFVLARQEGYEKALAGRFALLEHMAGSLVSAGPMPTTNPEIQTSTPVATPTPVEINGCLVNSMDAPFLSATWVVQLSEQSGLCRVIMKMSSPVGYSLLFPAGWEVSLWGPAEGSVMRGGLGFKVKTDSEPKILTWWQFTDLPLKSADSAVASQDTLQEKTTRMIGDKLTLIATSTDDDQTIRRYFIRYDSNDKYPQARLFVFEVTTPTAQFDQSEFQQRLKDVEAMIASFQYLLP